MSVLERHLARIELKLDRLIQGSKTMTQEVDDLNAAVTSLADAVNGATQRIDDLAGQIAAAAADGDHDAVEAAVAQIKAETAALVAATSATPSPEPQPEPGPVDPNT